VSDKTGISWTDATWNPIRGCSRVSEGCRHCYAETMAARFNKPGQPYHGLVKRRISGEAHWTGKVVLVLEHMLDPWRWQRPRRIFTNSMSDLFHENLSNIEIALIFAIMSASARHTFQVLTKRPDRMVDWFAWMYSDPIARMAEALTAHGINERALMRAATYGTPERSTGQAWPLPNVWLGASVEHQDAAFQRIPHLLSAPAAVRFLSCEPLLGPLELLHSGYLSRLDWIIAGCESGPGQRFCDVEWLRSLRDQCAKSRTPFFLKQAVDPSLTQIGRIEAHGITEAPGSKVKARGITEAPGSKVKARGVVELPLLDGKQYAEMPR
jgi:protein gp37